MTHSHISPFDKVVELFVEDLVLRRNSSGFIRLRAADVMQVSKYFDRVCDAPGRLPWNERLRAVRENRYISFGCAGNLSDICTILFSMIIENREHQVVFVESKSQALNTFEKLSGIFSLIGVDVSLLKCGEFCTPHRVENAASLKVATMSDLVDDFYIKLNKSADTAPHRKPILVFNGSKTQSPTENSGYIPFYFNEPLRGVSRSDWKWLNGLLQTWSQKKTSSWHRENLSIADNIDVLIESNESFKNSKVNPLIRFSSWMIAYILDAMKENHVFCQFTQAGRVKIDVPESMKSTLPAAPIQQFMTILSKSHLGSEMTSDRISCQMPISTVHIQNILDLYSYKFCWIGMQKHGIGLNWVPQSGSVSVRRVKERGIQFPYPEIDFRVFHGESSLIKFLDSVDSTRSVIFTDGSLPARLGVREFSVIDDLERLADCKEVFFIGVPRSLNLNGILSIFRSASTVTFLFDKAFESSLLSDSGYEIMNNQLVRIALSQSKSKRFDRHLSVLFDSLNSNNVNSSLIKDEFEFLSRAQAGLDKTDLRDLHRRYSLLNGIQELQPRILQGLGMKISLNDIKE